MNKKSPNPQILLFAAITATIMSIADSMMEWEKKIYAGIFAFLTAIVAAKIAQLMIKGESAEE